MSAYLHFESRREILPGVVQLVAEHLHSEPLHHAGPGHHQLLVQADAALCQRLELSPQFSVAPAIPLGNLTDKYRALLAFAQQTRTLCSCDVLTFYENGNKALENVSTNFPTTLLLLG